MNVSMIDAIYILKDNGIRLISKRKETGTNEHDMFDDMLSGFFTALNDFTNKNLGEEGIEHIEFKSKRRLYFKNFSINDKNIKIMLLTSKKTDKDIEKMINGKSIELKWAIEDIVAYIDNNESLPMILEKQVKEKMQTIFGT